MKKIPPSPGLPAQISHYTTLQGLMGILDSNTIWASNAIFLNDKAELKHALEVSRKVIEKLSTNKAMKIWEKLIEDVFAELGNGALPDTYVACFCEDDDNLSQWRGYSGLNQGISITFNLDNLRETMKNTKNTYFFKVLYSKKSTAIKFYDAMEREIQRIAALEERIGNMTSTQKRNRLKSRVSALLPRFKHLGFKDEREWRFSIQEDTGELKFRVSGNKIVPYIAIERDGSPLPITSVRIGPGADQELTGKSVEVFLKKKGYDNVNVKLSEVPYRW